MKVPLRTAKHQKLQQQFTELGGDTGGIHGRLIPNLILGCSLDIGGLSSPCFSSPSKPSCCFPLLSPLQELVFLLLSHTPLRPGRCITAASLCCGSRLVPHTLRDHVYRVCLQRVVSFKTRRRSYKRRHDGRCRGSSPVQVISSLGGGNISAITVVRPVLVSYAFATLVPLVCCFLIKPAALSLNRYRKITSRFRGQ